MWKLVSWSLLAGSLWAEPRMLTLKEAMDQAGRLNPEVQLANLRILEAEATTKNVKSAYQPQVGVAVTGAYQTINLTNIGLFIPGFKDRVGPFRTFDARPRVTQNLLDLSLLSSIKGSKEREAERKFDAQTAKEATLLAVLQIYLQIQQAESRIKAAEARAVTAQAVLAQAREFEQAGTASKLDVARAEQQFYLEKTSIAAARGERNAMLTMLLRTVGIEQEDVAVEAPQIVVKPLAVVAASRPEVRAMDSRIRSAEWDRQRAERERLPRLAFVGDFGVAGAGPDRSLSTYGVGATLTIPLWTGGRIEADVQAAKVRIQQAQQQRRNVELQVAQEVKQAQAEADAALVGLRSAEEAVQASRTSVELARLRFTSGIATNLDTITAQGALAAAEDVAIRTRYEYFLARARYARAVGDVYLFFE